MARAILPLTLAALLAAVAAVSVLTSDPDGCHPDKMTVYRMVLHTYWTREKFPKHYPDWRPAAQWSKVYGVSHDRTYALFRLGRRVSAGARQLAETGRADALGAAPGTLDVFGAPAVPQGAGRTEAQFFVDGNHSRVSVMARMVPSPDWFVGVDGFDLCVDGNWLDSITIEADPLDAGTDNGFTFSAPDWPTAPQGVAYRITARYPAHPAGSFFYPHLRRLPPVATVQFIKLREYEVSEVFHRTDDDRSYDVIELDKMAHNSIDTADGNRALSIAEEVERNEAPRIVAAGALTTPGAGYDYYSVVGAPSSTAAPDEALGTVPHEAHDTLPHEAHGTLPHEAHGTLPHEVHDTLPREAHGSVPDVHGAALRGLARRYRARRRRKMRPDDGPAARRRRKRAKLLDCRVSEWGEWSECRGEGGCVGAARRSRRVLRRARPGGAPCPPTAQSRWCAAACPAPPPPPDWRDNLT